MGGLKAKLNFVKIKDFLFKNKKRKIIIACAFALAVVLVLCAILIPVLSNTNKMFKSEAEMLTYMTGVYVSEEFKDEFYIFNENEKCYKVFSKDDFVSYFEKYLSETKDLEALKNMTFDECITNMTQAYLEPINISFNYTNNKIFIHGDISAYDRTITINDDSITIYYPYQGEYTSNFKKLADTPLECDELKEYFENAKKSGIDALVLVPSFKELKEWIKTDSRASALVNTNYNMSAINNSDMDMFYLGKCTKANQNESAFISKADEGLLLYSTDPTVALNGLLTIIDLYLQDVPTYPGESVHANIKSEIQNGKVIQNYNGNIINSEFNLYGIYFQTSYQERINGTTMYMISVHPKTISLS